jgi:hypothetical protein
MASLPVSELQVISSAFPDVAVWAESLSVCEGGTSAFGERLDVIGMPSWFEAFPAACALPIGGVVEGHSLAGVESPGIRHSSSFPVDGVE